jgi:predicted dienelactone hydrolase
MKKIMGILSLAILLIASGSGFALTNASAKDIEGVWKGTLEIQGQSIPIIVKISKQADGTLKATLDSPAQGAKDVPLNNVSYENTKLRFELKSVQGVYEGTLAESGDVIEGAWTQGGTPLPLNLKRSEGKEEEIPEYKIPENPFPKLTGPYPIGTHDYFWIDQNRDELFTTDPKDKRHLMVQVWYPAEKVERAEPYPYINNPEQYGDWKEYKPALHVKTNAVLDAPMAKTQSRYPILIYNHGGGWMRNIATFQTEMLANHGYVVFSIDHTGFNKTVVFPDGYKFVHDANKFPEPTGKSADDARASFEYLGDLPFKAWVGDISFVIDQIEKLNRKPGCIFHNRLDLEKIGSFGWSFGGAASVQVAKDDDRVKAVVDCDGQLFGDVPETGIEEPVLMMHGEIEKPSPDQMSPEEFDKLLKEIRALDTSFLAKTKNDRYVLRIKKSQHGSFSDLMLFFPQVPHEIDRHLAHEIINAYTLAFFDRYLKGKKSPLLDQVPSKYKEVEFKKIEN